MIYFKNKTKNQNKKKNPEDYPKINPPSTNKYVSEREIAFIQSCFDPEQKKKEEQYILPLKTTPDVINQKRKQLIEIFSYFDKDQTGLINVPELRNVMELLQVNEKSHVDTLIERAEIEGNGYINYRDFVYYIIK